MATSKWPQVEERLEVIAKWARDGMTEKHMCKNLRINESTFAVYKNKYPKLKEALKKGKEPFITEIENALVKRAKGFEYEETKTYIKEVDGQSVKYQEKTKKYYPPDVAACYILLKNKDKDDNNVPKWSDNPAKMQLDRELNNIKKQVEELKLF